MRTREEAVSEFWSTEKIENSPVERNDARRVCLECEHGVDWSSARAAIRVWSSVLHEVASIVCVCLPGATSRIVGDDDPTDEYTIVSPIRTRLGPLPSEAPIPPFSCEKEHAGDDGSPSESAGSISWVTALVLGLGSNV